MSEQYLYELFHDCTVRLKTPSDRGTGFFVAPRRLLTCYHIVKETEAENIEVHWRDRSYVVTRVETPQDPETFDLALLHVEIEAHPCVLLDREVLPFDRLYAYGYPTMGNNFALCLCEGADETILSVTSDAVRPGLSGAPLLNKRTKKVCGIVKSELKVRLHGSTLRGFGGNAIPAIAIFENWLDLEGENHQQHPENSPWRQFVPTVSPPNNLPSSYAPTCVGRSQDLQALHEQLQQGDRGAISTVTGMGGIGKTELALQYARRYGREYYPGGVCWLGARDENVGLGIVNYGRSLLELKSPDDLPLENRVEYCWRNWGGEGDVLAILDDVVDFREIARFLPRNNPRFKIVLTTRLQGLAETFAHLDLQVLAEEEALALLESFIGTKRLEREKEEAKGLCEWLGYLPLGLELVGQYLKQKEELSLAQMRERLENKRLQQRSLIKPTRQTTAQKGVKAAFELSWQELNEEAREVACLLSLFAVTPIPWKTVRECFDWDEEDLEDIRDDVLVQLSLLQKVEASRYQLHSLLREFMRDKLEESQNTERWKRKYCQVMVEAALQMPGNPTVKEIEGFTVFIPHLEEVANNLCDWVENDELIKPFWGLGWYYQGQGFYSQAEPWYEQCLQVTRDRLGEEHRDVGNSLNNLAQVYNFQGKYEEAASLSLQALELRIKFLGVTHSNVAQSLNNLALIYYNQGRYGEAEILFLQALQLWQQLSKKYRPDVATAINNLAQLYFSQERYEEAEPLFLQALELRKNLLGEDHPDVATSLNNLAGFHSNQGRYEEAKSLSLQALELRKNLLGSEHPDVANSLNTLASICYAEKRYEKAESISFQALEIIKKTLGKEHKSIAVILNNLAGIYSTQGKYKEAESLSLQALEIDKKLLGEEHLDIANSFNTLAVIYSYQEKYKEAEFLYLQALEINKKLLGEEHHSVVNLLNSLAEIYRLQGRYEEAVRLLSQSLELNKKLLGKEHPRVATGLNNLAVLYYNQGRYKEAENLYLQSLKLNKKLLGEEHPHTKSGLESLWICLQRAIVSGQRDKLSNHPLTQQILKAIEASEGNK